MAAEEAKQAGNAAFAAGDWAAAEEHYSRGLQADPQPQETLRKQLLGNRAMARLRLQRNVDAEKDCSAALEIDPRYLKVLVRRGMARAAMGRQAAAASDLRAALQVDPGNRRAQELLSSLDVQVEVEQTSFWKQLAGDVVPGVGLCVAWCALVALVAWAAGADAAPAARERGGEVVLEPLGPADAAFVAVKDEGGEALTDAAAWCAETQAWGAVDVDGLHADWLYTPLEGGAVAVDPRTGAVRGLGLAWSPLSARLDSEIGLPDAGAAPEVPVARVGRGGALVSLRDGSALLLRRSINDGDGSHWEYQPAATPGARGELVARVATGSAALELSAAGELHASPLRPTEDAARRVPCPGGPFAAVVGAVMQPGAAYALDAAGRLHALAAHAEGCAALHPPLAIGGVGALASVPGYVLAHLADERELVAVNVTAVAALAPEVVARVPAPGPPARVAADRGWAVVGGQTFRAQLPEPTLPPFSATKLAMFAGCVVLGFGWQLWRRWGRFRFRSRSGSGSGSGGGHTCAHHASGSSGSDEPPRVEELPPEDTPPATDNPPADEADTPPADEADTPPADDPPADNADTDKANDGPDDDWCHVPGPGPTQRTPQQWASLDVDAMLAAEDERLLREDGLTDQQILQQRVMDIAQDPSLSYADKMRAGMRALGQEAPAGLEERQARAEVEELLLDPRRSPEEKLHALGKLSS